MSDFADYISLYMDSAQKYNTDVQPAPYPPPGSSGPSPTYLSSNVDSQSVSQSEFYTPETPYGPNEPPQSSELPEMLLGQSNQQRPPSPARRSMFDYVSPFDALSNSTPQTKRKPVPSQPSGAGSNTDDSSWTTNMAMDPKRKSVENLMEQLTKAQGPIQPPAQSVTAQFDPYAPSEELATPQAETQRASRPLPPHPTQQSPRSSPPKVSAQARQQRQSVESPIGPLGPQGGFYQQPRRDKENSPFRSMANEGRGKGNGPRGKNAAKYVLADNVMVFFY